jgi:hypothetical protein
MADKKYLPDHTGLPSPSELASHIEPGFAVLLHRGEILPWQEKF